MKDSAPYELDHLLGASPGSASILAIMTASGSRPLETDLETVQDGVDTVVTQEATDEVIEWC